MRKAQEQGKYEAEGDSSAFRRDTKEERLGAKTVGKLRLSAFENRMQITTCW